jgi:hypothetical protein
MQATPVRILPSRSGWGARDRSFGQLQVLVGGADRKGRSLYALKYLGEQEPYGVFAANVGSGHKNGAHWIPYEEDADDDS